MKSVLRLLLSALLIARGVGQSKQLNTWTQDRAVLLTSLGDLRAHAKGSLTVADGDVMFQAGSQSETIDRSHVLSVSTGDERMEKGGKTGRIVRMALQQYGGPLWAMVSMGQIDLVTVEYVDARNGYHAAVFSVPHHSTDTLQETKTDPGTENSKPECSVSSSAPVAELLVLPISGENMEVPAEYRGLVYEHLMERLNRKQSQFHAVRAGDTAVNGCNAFTLTLKVQAFVKGNATERAIAGPAGLFLGATRLRYEVTLLDTENRPLLSEVLSSSKRGDSESLSVSDAVAKTVFKRLSKVETASTTPKQPKG